MERSGGLKRTGRINVRKPGEEKPRHGPSYEGLKLGKGAGRGAGKSQRTSPHQTSSEAGEKPRKRKKKRNRQAGVYGPYHDFVRHRLPCIFRRRIGHRCWGRNTAHHLKSVGSGGKDYANEIPCCEGLHTEMETLGNAEFSRRYEVDLEAIAHQVAEEYDRAMAAARRGGARVVGSRWAEEIAPAPEYEVGSHDVEADGHDAESGGGEPVRVRVLKLVGDPPDVPDRKRRRRSHVSDTQE